MFITVGNSFINLCSLVITWLTGNFIGGLYMFIIVCFVFSVIYHLGGKN